MTKSKVLGAWLPGLPHILQPGLNGGYRSLFDAAKDVGKEFQALGVRRILYYSTQWLSVLGHSIQTRPRIVGKHVDENWYDFASLPFDFRVDTKLASSVARVVSDAGFQSRLVDYEGFPIDTGTITADTLLNPTKIPVSMFSCCVYSDYAETARLGALIRSSLEQMEGTSAVVVVSGLSGGYFATDIDMREDCFSDPADDVANRKLLAEMEKGDWLAVASMRDDYCRSHKADMGLKGLAFLEGVGVAVKGQKLKSRAYAPVYGSGAAVLFN